MVSGRPPVLKPELSALDRVLGLVARGNPAAVPRFGARDFQEAMGDYEEAVEIFRLLAALPERWETR